jgi:hypothetical protein
MCDQTAHLQLKIAADLNVTGQEEWKTVQIDGCIASLVAALQAGGIDMRGSCCGHGAREGFIHLNDGRALLLLSKDQALWYFANGSPLLASGRA